MNPLSLSQLNTHVRHVIHTQLNEYYWIRAETSDVRRNANGHCYLEFVEKDSITQHIIAKARGMIWSNVFQMLSTYFETETGQSFKSGLKVLVRVSVDFHELFGYSLTVVDIDPSFTVGDIERNRQFILKQLEKDGVLSLNKELIFPECMNRVAVISSPTAAGYEDFIDQLTKNTEGFQYYIKLFPAIMQGDKSESSIIAALEKIYIHRSLFDVVVIIRGGGATSDLNCFDNYPVAFNCAHFPLPIISGIGHERDVTVLDVVAHTRVKTPTAAADILIQHLSKTTNQVNDFQKRLLERSQRIVLNNQSDLSLFTKTLVQQSLTLLNSENNRILKTTDSIKFGINSLMQKELHACAIKQQYIEMVSPENLLKRGYTLTLRNGKIAKSVAEFSENDVLETRFVDGSVWSVVKK